MHQKGWDVSEEQKAAITYGFVGHLSPFHFSGIGGQSPLPSISTARREPPPPQRGHRARRGGNGGGGGDDDTDDDEPRRPGRHGHGGGGAPPPPPPGHAAAVAPQQPQPQGGGGLKPVKPVPWTGERKDAHSFLQRLATYFRHPQNAGFDEETYIATAMGYISHTDAKTWVNNWLTGGVVYNTYDEFQEDFRNNFGEALQQQRGLHDYLALVQTGDVIAFNRAFNEAVQNAMLDPNSGEVLRHYANRIKKSLSDKIKNLPPGSIRPTTLAQWQEHTQYWELTWAQSKLEREMDSRSAEKQNIRAVNTNATNNPAGYRPAKPPLPESLVGKCLQCGEDQHKDRKICKYKPGDKCSHCGLTNHWNNACIQKHRDAATQYNNNAGAKIRVVQDNQEDDSSKD